MKIMEEYDKTEEIYQTLLETTWENDCFIRNLDVLCYTEVLFHVHLLTLTEQ